MVGEKGSLKSIARCALELNFGTRLAHDPTLVQGEFSVLLAPVATLRVACLWRRRVDDWFAPLRPRIHSSHDR